MNTNTKIVLLLGAAILGQFGVSVSAGETDWLKICGAIAAALATTIGGIFIRLPQKEWSEEEREAKLGEVK